jgi:Nickel responsive protein SCO4226-like
MPRFMDVHHHAESISQSDLEEAHRQDQQYEAAEGVRFLKAWADPGSGKIFCLSEGPNLDAVKRVHEKAGHPADEIYEVPLSID